MNFIEIKNRLALGDFSFLLSLFEDEQFEVKRGKYDISGDNGKMELAKDISSFANRGGGLIVIGAVTSDDASSFGRRVESLSLFSFNLINPPDYYNVIKDWIYPKPENMGINWIPAKDDNERGLVYIYVPLQPENLRPFLIKKDIDPETNRKRKEILFGYAERVSHTSDPITVEGMHTMLRLGRENRWKEEIAGRMSALESRLAEPPEQKERRRNLKDIVLPRVKAAIDVSDLTNFRNYSLVISPLELTQIDSLFDSKPDSIARLMEKPPSLREAGWGLETGDSSRIIAGELRRVKSDQYKILDVYRDGTCIFSCRADGVFLGFGNHFGDTKINPLALVEPTYLFFTFYESVLTNLEPRPQKFDIWIQFNNLHEGDSRTTLAPGDVNRHVDYMRDDYRHEAPSSHFEQIISVDVEGFDAANVAPLVLRKIYAWFGFEEDKIPYLTEKKLIDIAKIINPK